MRRLLATTAALVALAAAPAHAATKVVLAGYDAPPGAPPGTVAEGFFPDVITIHAGDKVQWQFRGSHVVELFAKGQRRPDFVVADTTQKLPPQNDAAGQPFWWGGQPALLENPQIVDPRGGRSYPGSGWFDSGAGATTYTLRFLRTGTYRYQDAMHPGVRGTVKVVPKRSRVQSRRADNALAAAEITHATDTARDIFHAAPPPAGVVDVGREANGVAVNAFFPAAIQIPTGTSLTFQVAHRGVELQAVTLGPEATELAHTPLLPNGQIDPRLAYPSDPPPTLPDYTGSNHGDGFLNSGLLDGDPRTPLPGSATIRFTAPGTYTVASPLHPGMTATVNVTG